MKILVTGGAGFIGSNFIRYVLKKYSNGDGCKLIPETTFKRAYNE